MNTPNDTIVAPATAAGGAIAVVRMSGPSALAICDTVFSGARRAGEAAGYTVLYGTIADGARVLDDVLVTVFRAPHSYTGEDAVEISCHGSRYIVRELLALLVRRGARMATPANSLRAPFSAASSTCRRPKRSPDPDRFGFACGTYTGHRPDARRLLRRVGNAARRVAAARLAARTRTRFRRGRGRIRRPH